jgi:response regulator RpfG family c-di-GMP phosphodiesterase
MRDFFADLQNIYEQIQRHQNGRLVPSLTADDVILRYRENNGVFHSYRENIERIVNEHLKPMLDNIAGISDDEEAGLFAMVQKISSYETRLDPSMALLIYQGLLDRAQERGDTDNIIKYLYWCGVTLFFFQRERGEEILDYYERGAAYKDRYFELENEETRKYIHRCLNNHIMTLYAPIRDIEKAMQTEIEYCNFWNRIIFSGKDADFPWLSYFISLFSYRYGHLTRIVHTDPDSETRENLNKILEVAITINKLYHKNSKIYSVFGGTRYDNILWEAQFLNGLISFNQYYENIKKRQDTVAADDYSMEAIYIMLQLPNYVMFYASKMKKLKSVKHKILADSSKRLIEYALSIPMSVNPKDVSTQLRTFASNLSDIMDPMEQLNLTLRLTTFRHIPTYAHSIMVGKLAVCITSELIAKNPASFIGCMDFVTESHVKAQASMLCGFAEMSGLCHDIGKVSYASNPFMMARVITEAEKKIVTSHPKEGYDILKRKDEVQVYNVYMDVILGHHKHYDNVGGYPHDFDLHNCRNRMLIEVIKAADSLDAATDNVGKAYAPAKCLDDVIAEIRTLAGKKYAPEIAALFDDADFTAKIRDILETERKKAYYAAYKHAWS